MRRRELLTACGAAGAALLGGCADRGRADAERQARSPTPTPWPDPRITDVTHSEVTYPSRPDLVLFRVEYVGLNPSAEYSVRVSLESAAGTTTVSKPIERVRGYYPGFATLQLRPAEGSDSDGSILRYEVSLLHEGEPAVTRTGSIE